MNSKTSQEMGTQKSKQIKTFVMQSLTIGTTGLLLSLMGSYGASAQTTSSSTTSSNNVNQSYSSQQFTTLPEGQLKSRMPVTSLKAPANSSVNTPANSSLINGIPGAAIGSTNAANMITPGNTPLANGTSGLAYSSSRVLGGTSNPAQSTYYRKAGKLYMAFGGTTYNYVCSASMIGKSLLVTAAHCVHDFGKGSTGWAKKVKFVPAKDNTLEPYQSFESTQFMIPTSYFNGTDTCSQAGVVCNNDIALVALNNNTQGQQAGNLVGWYGYGWNGYGYNIPASGYQGVFGNKQFASLTQLGYPAAFDSGNKMQINTGFGAVYTSGNLKNTWFGSPMTGGCSGGPWLVNLGENASGANYGSSSNRNLVVGVTSYGNSEQFLGASWFGQNVQFPNAAYGTRGAGNIGSLVYEACDSPTGWKLQSLGRCT
jgi:hypothetical protein